MPVLNHHIVACADKDATARFFAEILGLGQPVPLGPFAVLQVSGDTTLDFMDTDGEVASQHYAFLASEAEFDDGRGLYFADPNGHSLERRLVRDRQRRDPHAGLPPEQRLHPG
jgi:catechol 2,3-dioxygenase-like lactoylglutathione lyase family enzyme